MFVVCCSCCLLLFPFSRALLAIARGLSGHAFPPVHNPAVYGIELYQKEQSLKSGHVPHNHVYVLRALLLIH